MNERDERLQAELDHLEATDPAVAAAARSYDEMVEQLTQRREKDDCCPLCWPGGRRAFAPPMLCPAHERELLEKLAERRADVNFRVRLEERIEKDRRLLDRLDDRCSCGGRRGDGFDHGPAFCGGRT